MPRLSLAPLEDRRTPAFADLDPTFGGGGTATLAVPGGEFRAAAADFAPDGGAVLGGTFFPAGGGRASQAAVVRLTRAGAPDPAFGDGGLARVGDPTASSGGPVAVAPDGRVVLAGATALNLSALSQVFRLTADGRPDPTFGPAGVAERPDGGWPGRFEAVAVGPDGRVTLAGNSSSVPPGTTHVLSYPAGSTSVVRLTPDGRPDPGFNGGRRVDFPGAGSVSAGANGLALLPDGRAVVGGTFPSDAGVPYAGVARLTADGRPDPGFGTAGVVRLPGDRLFQSFALAARSDGAVGVAGYRYTPAGADERVVARLRPDGSPDPGFAAGGYAAAGRYVNNGPLTLQFSRDGGMVAVNQEGQVLRVSAGGAVAEPAGRPAGRPDTVAIAPDGAVLAVAGAAVTRTQGLARPAAGDTLAGGSPDGFVQVLAAAGGGGRYEVFPTFTVPVRTAAADLTGDGVPDLVAGAGPGAVPNVQVVSGATGQAVADFLAFERAFAGGVFVALGDLTGDGVPDLVVTPDRGGGPVVAVYDGAALAAGRPAELARFYGIEDAGFRGGARAAAGDADGDGRPDLIVAAGFGGGPRVAVYAGTTALQSGGRVPRRLVDDFFVFEESLRNGVFVTALDLTGDGAVEVVVGGGPGGGPRVLALDGRALAGGRRTVAADFFAGDPAARGGVRLAARGGNLITGSGEGQPAEVRVYAPAAARLGGPADRTLAPFDGAGLADGVYVG